MKTTITRKMPTVSLMHLGYLLIVCAAVWRAMQFHVESGDNMDLARHLYMMQLIKKSDYSFLEYVFLHGDAFTSNITMRFGYAFNAAAYLVAKYTTNYYIISWLFIFIDYCIVAWIGIDWWKSQGGREKFVFLYEILLCFSLLPFIHAVSGLRTAMAACIMALAIYRYICKNKNLLSFAILSVLAATVHPAFITAVPFALLAKKVSRKKGLIIALAGSLSVSLVARIMVKSSNRFLYAIAFKYLQYSGDEGYRGTRFCYYGVIAICMLTLAIYFYVLLRDRRNKGIGTISAEAHQIMPGIKIYDFIAYYMLFTLSNIGTYEMVLRSGYLVGALAPVLTGLVFHVRGEQRKRDVIINLLLIVLLIIALYVSFKYFLWHRDSFRGIIF